MLDNRFSQEKWEKSINKAISLLEKNGLWKDMLKELRLAKEVGYDTINKAYEIYRDIFSRNDDENKKIIAQKIGELDERLLMDKETPNHLVVDKLCKFFKLKRMNFGKNYNKEKFKFISEAMKNKQKIRVTGENSRYNFIFSYNPDSNQAWYDEEYKNGYTNGHCYLAISDRYAAFMEGD